MLWSVLRLSSLDRKGGREERMVRREEGREGRREKRRKE
jgi:hypothetical protein